MTQEYFLTDVTQRAKGQLPGVHANLPFIQIEHRISNSQFQFCLRPPREDITSHRLQSV